MPIRISFAASPPSLLQIELTESTIFERREGRNGELNQDAVTHLRDLGVHIAIDDFGTGYSSLSYLKHWRVDSLKIDRSFVRDLVSDPSDLAIVGAITAMARHLSVPVTAEGKRRKPRSLERRHRPLRGARRRMPSRY